MFKALITSLLLLGISFAAQAGDITAGKEKAGMCAGCHGEDGNSPVAIWPSLAGQQPSYLVKQMKDFKSGARENETMASMMEALSAQDMADISAYFASMAPASTSTSDDEGLLTLGERIYKGGNMESKLAACAGCHGPTAQGNNPAKFPGLVGQHSDYVVAQLQMFAEGARNNDLNNMMVDIAARMTKKEIEAVSAYLASLGSK